MTTPNTHRLFTVLAAFLLLVGMGAALHAVEEGEMVDLSGQLTQTEDGQFLLVEEASGESIALMAADGVDLESHVGTSVQVSGEWTETEEGLRYFNVTQIEPRPIEA